VLLKGTENLVLSLFKKHHGVSGKELIKKDLVAMQELPSPENSLL
jgi:hypothetical protein